MDYKKLHDFVAKNQKNICQITVMKKGNLVYTDTWNGFSENDNLHIASVTKSIISLLIGIAIDRNLIIDLDQKILDFYPDYQIKRGEKTIQQIRLRHMLSMTAPYKFKSEPWTRVCSSSDWTKAVLDLLGGRAGITREFKYVTLGIQVLSDIIYKTSGISTIEFANRVLFSPLGIKARIPYIAKNKEEHIAFITSKESRKGVWLCEPKGIAAAGFGLCMSSMDMAKIGQMCLEEGVYYNQKIIPSDWIKEMRSPFVQCGERFGNMAYGYLWWIIDSKNNVYAAIGDGGNVIYVNPGKELIIAVTSTFKPAVFDRIQFICEYIEPMVC
ncbi:serine hydrolase domain-containing protein [Tepidimicrobium xylanilyticum]|uniref:CubicO group peptidase, beta-lactamase class C family n=1 Tax=Tepidimicrobium xylanilyticum TaxID=1123352 RepID=A0A1H3EDP8_9FIRM|nr:serine hydrolase [Tepidimicrobium xylanilyticum]SDX76755.1 CubicO group peptidase, beta-lactamase class C family [Tepidimicrobium xylanilyticum]